MRAWVAVALVASACGRLGFDASSVSASDAASADVPTGAGAPVFVQTAANNSGSATTNLTPFTMDVTAGNLIVAAYNYFPNTVSVVSLADTQNNAFTMLGPFDGSGGRQYVFYAPATMTGPDTIDVTIDNPPDARGSIMRMLEYANVAASPYDTSAAGAGSSTATDAARTPDFTTSGTDEVIVGVIISGTVLAGTGFTTRNPFSGDLVEDRTAATAGTYAVTATADGAWQATAVAFRGAGSH